MATKPYKEFSPNWYTEESPKGSYRAIFKWGDPKAYKIPKENLYKMVKELFKMTDEDFVRQENELGLEKVEYNIPPTLSAAHIAALTAIVGEKNASQTDYDRLSVAYGQTMLDLMRMRKKIIENLPDIVLYPENKEQIIKIVDYCNANLIPLYVYGGGSSVTRGPECMKNGVSLDMRRNFNKVIEFNEKNQTITVQAGMMGPALEKILNNATTNELKAKQPYSCGHFPQSFEYSSVGGWVVTRGAGQNSTYYGKIEDIVLSQEYATPIGYIKTDNTPRKATGPDIDQIMMGSEGTFGILTHVTLRLFKWQPQNHVKYSYMFKTWDDAMNACREVMQGEFGMPSVFRVSDQEETQMMMRMYGITDSPLDKLLQFRGYKEMEKCLLLGFTDGEKKFGKNVAKNIGKIAHKHGGMSLTGVVTTSWEHGRFSDPYMRDNLQDFNIIIDTLECSVNWDNMEQVHLDVRKYCKSRPNTIVTTHISHMYPQGGNLYFIFITPEKDIAEFRKYHSGLLDAIQQSGAAISHHHGIGKFFAPWLEGFMGEKQYDIIKVLKQHFDPNGVMNPGGTLGFDLKPEEKHFKK
ncbi:MAG: FAD-binding oxidoreductase [Christensenellaceae bacterium]|jgi:alkyldihydroxyacetonephosphate synthase|nr:FAD-binding oxidoreductase [Christensenellaceae bacterium]